MRKTLEEFGWIVILLIILSVMILAATPIAKTVGNGIDDMANAFFPTGATDEQLNTPSILIKDGVLNIRGDYRSDEFEIYADNVLLDTVDVENVDLAAYPWTSGNHTIKVIALAENYKPSSPSAEMIYAYDNSVTIPFPDVPEYGVGNPAPPSAYQDGDYLVVTASDEKTEEINVRFDTGENETLAVSEASPTVRFLIPENAGQATLTAISSVYGDSHPSIIYVNIVIED